MQFNAFLQDKLRTQTISGEIQSEFYEKEGTLRKSRMLVSMHPDVCRLVLKFGAGKIMLINVLQKEQVISKDNIRVAKSIDDYLIRIIQVVIKNSPECSERV